MEETTTKEVTVFYVEIVRYEDEEVVKRFGPHTERRADKIDAGANINLNHDAYFTRIVEEADA